MSRPQEFLWRWMLFFEYRHLVPPFNSQNNAVCFLINISLHSLARLTYQFPYMSKLFSQIWSLAKKTAIDTRNDLCKFISGQGSTETTLKPRSVNLSRSRSILCTSIHLAPLSTRSKCQELDNRFDYFEQALVGNFLLVERRVRRPILLCQRTMARSRTLASRKWKDRARNPPPQTLPQALPQANRVIRLQAHQPDGPSIS
ncbi:hypothetical protein IW261DRAFT_1126224 [Armillaria novae-zelandiae]|uniref:Uncharacterized protein n=1 Tax=Armillaria novae-zelandiae TaxID=153914 RepID=A0AA39PAP4_9AGAR|nr:hypothetical protein IW261DRAFT_1126224 [Armillaria novae-zelandiae]